MNRVESDCMELSQEDLVPGKVRLIHLWLGGST